MGISIKTRILLWGKAGIRCAICKNELVTDATETDDASIIGEHCHIISKKGKGPRHDSSVPAKDLDGYFNLILLCRNHHKVVDDQVNGYTVEILQGIKQDHEKWVSDNLDPENIVVPKTKTEIRREKVTRVMMITAFLILLVPLLVISLSLNGVFDGPAFLKGRVTLQNSGGPPVKGASIKADGAEAVVSDNHGFFTLKFEKKKPGDQVVLAVVKENMEVVNPEELKRELPSLPDGKIFEIVMCDVGDRDRHAMKYHRIAKDAIEKSYEKELKRLQGKEKEIEKLTAERDFALAQVEDLAKQFAEKNLDDAGELYKQAFEHFKKGEIDKAIEVLDDAKIEEEIRKGKEKIKRSADNYKLKAELYITQLQFDKAEEYYQKAVQTAPDDFWNNFSFAKFLKNQTHYEKAIHYYKNAFLLANNLEYKAGVLNNTSTLYVNTNNLTAALSASHEALTIFKELALKRNINHYKQNVVIAQNNQGILLKKINRIEEALATFREALKISKELAIKNPDAFYPDVAMTQNNLGTLYADLNRFREALTAFKEALAIYKDLVKKKPTAFLQYVAATQNNLGLLHADNNRSDEALAAYNEALNIYKKLAEKNPDAFLKYVATTQNNLGNLHYANNRADEALAAFTEALNIYKKLADKNPDAFLQYVATTQNNLGLLYADNNRVEEALAAYTEALNIYKKLADKNPDAFLQYVATTQNNLGILYATQQQFDKAKEALEEALNIRQELRQRNPRAFDIDFCGTSHVLAWMYSEMASKDGNPAHLKKAQSLLDEAIPILQKYPDVPQAQKYLGAALKIKKIIETGSKKPK